MKGENKVNKLPCPPNCTKCIDACPTGALQSPFKLNPVICIPYLTYRKSGITPEKYRKAMGTWLYGCDICQNVCPLNEGKWCENKEYYPLEKIADKINLSTLYNMNEDFFKREIYSRFYYLDDIIRLLNSLFLQL